jgi:SET domain-containing protein
LEVIIFKEKFEVREINGKGKGLFTLEKIKKGKLIFHNDLTQLPSYKLDELHNHPQFEKFHDHSDYVGDGKYVIDLSPVSYMNHSCDPNCVVKMKTTKISDYYALRDIEPDEELTHDYSLTSFDQFAGKGFWVLDCQCESEKCRGKVTGDFFALDKEIQRKYYQNLPPSILEKYEEKIRMVLDSD